MVWIWVGFILCVLLMLALDLGVFHRNAHVVTMKEALTWSAVWITMGLSFSVLVYYGYENHWLGLGSTADAVDGVINNGMTATIKYLTGYVVEKSLSVDNIFVIAMIFGFFAVPPIYQHRVLFWGILGALAMRGAMIALGAALIAEYHWVLYVFGVFLIITGIKMLILKTDHTDPNQNIIVRLTRRVFPITARFHGQHFVVRAGAPASYESEFPGTAAIPDEAVDRARPGTWMLTPLALALIMIEFTDLIFAVDSIPAIFAITARPVPGFHQQRFCNSRPSVALFRAGRHAREVQVPEGGAGVGVDGGWREDADRQVAQGTARQRLQLLPARGRAPDPGCRCCLVPDC